MDTSFLSFMIYIVKIILCVGQLWPALQYRNRGNCLHVLSTVQLNMAPWIFLCPAESRTLAFSMQLNTDYTSEGNLCRVDCQQILSGSAHIWLQIQKLWLYLSCPTFQGQVSLEHHRHL